MIKIACVLKLYLNVLLGFLTSNIYIRAKGVFVSLQVI